MWWGSRVECASAFMRAVRERRLSPASETQARADMQALFVDVHEVVPSEDLRDRAERLLPVHPLRAADALQLAAALIRSRERTAGLGFVCLDARLREAVRREGFTVLPPDPAGAGGPPR